jgi:ABC-type multidrug transport system ATPase subunit
MEIIAGNIGKKFSKEWIFRNLSFHLKNNQSLAITGANGSGKSTLLQILAGAITPSEGQVDYIKGKLSIAPEHFYQSISLATPYLELVEEMTIYELAEFHQCFKSFSDNISTPEFLSKIMLGHAANKEIRYLSSGMKQRVKLGLALFSDTAVLMLDEPTTNLDTKGTDWYLEEINKLLGKKIIIICSNQRHEYDFCEETILVRKN